MINAIRFRTRYQYPFAVLRLHVHIHQSQRYCCFFISNCTSFIFYITSNSSQHITSSSPEFISIPTGINLSPWANLDSEYSSWFWFCLLWSSVIYVSSATYMHCIEFPPAQNLHDCMYIQITLLNLIVIFLSSHFCNGFLLLIFSAYIQNRKRRNPVFWSYWYHFYCQMNIPFFSLSHWKYNEFHGFGTDSPLQIIHSIMDAVLLD